jgi:1-phosphofructokinase
MPQDRHTVCIFAPALFVTVTIEKGDDDRDDIHIHPGGQGFWIARMVRHLGESAVLCAPLGGETGRVAQAIMPDWGIDLAPIPIAGSSPAYVHDRRTGERHPVAERACPILDRHELDDVYASFLDHALAADVCVITGRADKLFSAETYRRFGSDLAANGVRVVGDFHGAELHAFLDGGPIDVLKVSDEDLTQDGEIEHTDEDLAGAIARLRARGVETVIVSRGARPAVARFDHVMITARPPELKEVDHRGAGDSMTAALAVGLSRGMLPEEMLRLACAAGAANVARHGLGNASVDLIAQLADRVELIRVAEAVS